MLDTHLRAYIYTKLSGALKEDSEYLNASVIQIIEFQIISLNI